MNEKDVFAEIEYDSIPSGASADKTGRGLILPAARALPVAEGSSDPIRQKFYNMRSIVSGNPFARNDVGFFYRQAEFMEDFSDDYEGNADFFMYYPCYQHMGYEQLRTYFTWRAKVRRGDVTFTALSYVFLYIYELLSGIGASGPKDGLDKLMVIWNAFQKHTNSLDYYLPKWLYDYHVYYELPHSFKEFISAHNLKSYYSEYFLFDADDENCLDSWNRTSNYDIIKSNFYNAGNDALVRQCFCAVIRAISEECRRQGVFADDMLGCSSDDLTSWYPFQRTLFHNWLSQPDRQVEMPGRKNYYCKNNRWKTNTYLPYAWQAILAGYLIKKTEACLRNAAKYKFAIKADSTFVRSCFKTLRNPHLTFKDLDIVIEKAVAGFYRDMSRTIVTVNHQNLARIRAEALGTQEKLIVPEENARNGHAPDSEGALRAAPIRDTSGKSRASASVIANMDAAAARFGADASLPEQKAEPAAPAFDGWASLKEVLSVTELHALSLVLRGGADIKAFADENGIMLEVLADSINEKAADHIGDNVLEVGDGVTIYDEYREKINGVCSVVPGSLLF
ncbi:MAG: TerB N-terminal domain-containing protein [Oscillospiraceae bacterium]|nr:TerB N-terminal domain-containing protein [Oscillospiraceae bacterium]